ncbi:MAG: hypothetical protein CL607_24805 [Anaerolineaceae bacterium]|nr:hypothetical protein [Anaerolineaceae bacterium]
MIDRLTEFLEAQYGFSPERTRQTLQQIAISLAVLGFWLSTAFVIAADSFLPGLNGVASLEVGAVAPRDIVAPTNVTFTSEILTEIERQNARDDVEPILSPPDPERVQQQTELASSILVFMRNVRRATYDTTNQKIEDIAAIQALDLDESISEAILRFDDETWTDIENEVLAVLPRVMRSVREDEIDAIREQLPTQVAVRFNANERRVIVAIVEDLISANRVVNLDATEEARQVAADAVSPVPRSFVTGERIVEAGSTISEADYEALSKMGLLRTQDRRTMDILRALLATIIVMVLTTLYFSRFTPEILQESHLLRLGLNVVLFLLMLLATRLLGVGGDIYLFPVAALALIYVAVADVHLAIAAGLAMSLLVGFMMNNSLEITVLVAAGSLAGALSLRSPGRLNSFFISGALVGVVNVGTITIFSLAAATTSDIGVIITRVLLSFISGALLAPATAIAVMYVVTTLFNLPTALRLLDLSQPNKPLLQRLLREAPGTYQHSLQVANLSEQAASAIDADSQLTHVAALYHDIGKMSNPLYFTENQQEHIGNPHDTLNDPARSADIIINHVIEGDEIAKQSRLPQRIRDFIREHHGTTTVYVFYQRALRQLGGDESQLDKGDFSYPGPIPQSRETGILMLADSCEAAVRSAKPESKGQISQIVRGIFNSKREEGQLDASGLTLNDLHIIEDIFVDILQSMFHPRINYREAVQGPSEVPANKGKAKETILVSQVTPTLNGEKVPPPETTSSPVSKPKKAEPSDTGRATPGRATREDDRAETKPIQNGDEAESFDEAPMTEVPRLPSRSDRKTTQTTPRVNVEGDDTQAPTDNSPETDDA